MTGWGQTRVPLKVGEIWILGESLNGSLRESAAHSSSRDVPTEVGSRNRFPRPDRPIRTTLQKPGCSFVAWAVSAHPRPDRPIRTTLQKPDCSSVVWAVSAHPRPISTNLRDSILTHFKSHPAHSGLDQTPQCFLS